MVRNINVQQPFGIVNRVGTSPDGRILYQVIDPRGQETAKMSVAPQDCDKFEKSYTDIMTAAPKLQKFAIEHNSPQEMAKRQKTAKRFVGFGALFGFLIPIPFTAKFKNHALLKQMLISTGGLIAGLFAGSKLATLFVAPPGTAKLERASKTLSKLDIQIYKD
ncbi:MAG: respiratory nitrate reductase subunit gamma [bacterium]|nr:respiratory nitrate reductase subunit gamma [bacterium]